MLATDRLSGSPSNAKETRSLKRQFYSYPNGPGSIQDPEPYHDIVAWHCQNIAKAFPKLARVRDFRARLPRYKRDLTYIGEVARDGGETEYCVALALGINFGLTMPPDILEKPIALNNNLRRRVYELIQCCEPDVLSLHPILKSRPSASEIES